MLLPVPVMHRAVIVWLKIIMAAAGCIFLRTLGRARDRPGPGPDRARDRPGPSQASPILCRDVLQVVELRRYTRDQASPVLFPQAVFHSDDLFDVTLTDGDCKLQVTLDPGLNHLVERRVLRPGRPVYSSTFSPAMTASGDGESFRLVAVEMKDDGEDGDRRTERDWDALPWFCMSQPTGPPVPLRANRSVFLPLWNDVDHSGEAWTEAPPTEDEDDEDESGERRRSAVSVSQLRDDFLAARRRITRTTVEHQLIVRIVNKSRLSYYGRTDRNCPCPYKAVLEVCDPSGSVCVVFWNSVCVRWFCRLQLGDIISLRRYRVKPRFSAGSDDIEISVNSRNPHTLISALPELSVCPAHLPAPPTYTFHNSQEVLDCRHGDVCDVIGLLTFSGRSERIRSQDGRGAGLLEYRWLRLDDGASDQPIMVKLFSTSQPDVHRRLLPVSVVVCCRLKVVHCPPSRFLTNTTFTQVYGTGQHSQMAYRKLRPVRRFLQWLRLQEDRQVLRRAVIGGFFLFPPPPVSLEAYLRSGGGELGLLRGAELQRDMKRLRYRERQTLCVQATVTMVTYRGQDGRCCFWTDKTLSPVFPGSSMSPMSSFPVSRAPSSASSSRRVQPSSPSSCQRVQPSSASSCPRVLPSLTSSCPRVQPSSCQRVQPSPCPRVLPSSTSSCARVLPSSTCSPRTLHRTNCLKRKKMFPSPEAPRCPWVTLQQDNNSQTVLFEASMEFLQGTEEEEEEEVEEDEEEEESDDDASSFVTSPLPPVITPIAMETLPMRYDHAHREEQAVAVAMGGGGVVNENFVYAVNDYYTLTLRALADGVPIDTVFLPQSSSARHSNTWTSILSHGAFSSDSPPPSSADLITMAPQLANQRLVCVLEACHLGGATTELILSRAFPL